MLQHLAISNFAIVRSLDIDWRKGMSTITGETGAGKSIAIDALGLCLGDRATTNTVRPGCDKAELCASFDISNNNTARQWLKTNDLLADEECIIRRVIFKEGRSNAYINGVKVPLAHLKLLGEHLINIHGQHDHQLLLKPQEQRRLLDDYARHENLLETVAIHYKNWRKLNIELETLKQSQNQRDAQKQLLEYQVNELDEFALQEREFENLEQEFKRHSHAQQLITDTNKTLIQLVDDDEFNALSVMQRAADTLSDLAECDDRLKTIAATLSDVVIQVEDACADLRSYVDKLDLDPETFSLIEQRYSSALLLAQKHHVKPEDLSEHHMHLSKELGAIKADSTRLDGILSEIESCKEDYINAANALSASRTGASKKLSKLITQSMRELNMPNAQFEAAITPIKSESPQINGVDDIVFTVSMNPGQPMEAMHKVASGGELSRISLAIQVILAQKVVTPTLIFDEVDVGISGPTAAMVGRKLRELGENTQVICVTHLPQVASKGNQQLFVTKLSDGEITETKVNELNEQARVREIARLLAGDSVTESSLANARELLAG